MVNFLVSYLALGWTNFFVNNSRCYFWSQFSSVSCDEFHWLEVVMLLLLLLELMRNFALSPLTLNFEENFGFA